MFGMFIPLEVLKLKLSATLSLALVRLLQPMIVVVGDRLGLLV